MRCLYLGDIQLPFIMRAPLQNPLQLIKKKAKRNVIHKQSLWISTLFFMSVLKNRKKSPSKIFIHVPYLLFFFLHISSITMGLEFLMKFFFVNNRTKVAKRNKKKTIEKNNNKKVRWVLNWKRSQKHGILARVQNHFYVVISIKVKF